jgi:hypothetical protein
MALRALCRLTPATPLQARIWDKTPQSHSCGKRMHCFIGPVCRNDAAISECNFEVRREEHGPIKYWVADPCFQSKLWIDLLGEDISIRHLVIHGLDGGIHIVDR